MSSESMSSKVSSEECLELKNIKYKTMLMSGSSIQETKSEQDMSNLEKFLEKEKTTNLNEPWTKLDKTIKTQKIIQFAEDYIEDNKLLASDKKPLVDYLKDCLSKKKLARVKDVNYDKENGKIIDIPLLIFNKQSRAFTLKRSEKRPSTLKSLPVGKRSVLKTSKKKDSLDSIESMDD